MSAENGVARGEIRRRLNSLGSRRKKRDEEGEQLVEDIKEAVAAARVVGGISMEEVADRLNLNRTTLYQVYLDPDDRREPRTA